jgi:amidase
MKPTVGLVSRTHIVPISVSQDTAGPIAASVREAAALLTAIAGSDQADPATEKPIRERPTMRGARPRRPCAASEWA